MTASLTTLVGAGSEAGLIDTDGDLFGTGGV